MKLNAQESGITWDYPIKPGSKEWNEREDRQNFMAGLRIMNIPSDTIELIKTEQLVKTCLNYPFWSLVFSRNSLQEGYDFLRIISMDFENLETDQMQLIIFCKSIKKCIQMTLHLDHLLFKKENT